MHKTFALIAVAALPAAAFPQDLQTLPVRDVTIFKDGHALMIHEGEVPLRKQSGKAEVLIGDTPAPVLGSFFPFTSAQGLQIQRVRTTDVTSSVDVSAKDLMELLQSAKGQRVTLRIGSGDNQRTVEGTVHEVVYKEGPPSEVRYVPRPPEPPQQKSPSLLLLQTDDGLLGLRPESVTEAIVHGTSEGKITAKQTGYEYTITAANGSLPDSATVGYAYIQRGLRWIPSYSLRLNDNGAPLTLQATVINEMRDMENVTARLAVGVPSVEFEGVLDPMAPYNYVAMLSEFFPTGQATSGGVNRAVMSQMAMSNAFRMEDAGGGAPQQQNLPQDTDGELYFFNVKDLTLKKGERVVMPLQEANVSARDVFRLKVPFAPPSSNGGPVPYRSDNPRDRRITNELNKPKVMRIIAFENNAGFPMTTAPVTVLDEQGRLMVQEILRYTPVGGEAEIELNAALNIPAETTETQIDQQPNATTINGTQYTRIVQEGTVTLTNRRSEPVTIVVKRDVMGEVRSSDPEAKITASDLAEVREQLEDSIGDEWRWRYPSLIELNGFDRIEWEVELQPGEKKTLTAQWEFLWQ